jgi:peptidoglycan hydrolase-like protein with peptidoglycan-binding domain
MITLGRRRMVAVVLGLAVLLAVAAWLAGRQIRSPAQVAAETAPPDPSAITVPVERQVLSSEVIVRGTVRYGSPQPVVLATSEVKQAGAGAEDIVTTQPRRGSTVGEGAVVMSVSGRPVFVLTGAQPSHRDLGPGARGPDVEQLESALARLGFSPGPVDGRYDGRTGAAVAAWYEEGGWAPFGATDTQREQLRAAEAAAAAARDIYLQSRLAVQTAAEGTVTPGDVEQARIDLETARDAVDTAELALTSAQIRARATQDLASQTTALTLALRAEERDNALADADLALKQSLLNKALDAQLEAQRNLVEAPPDTLPSEMATLQAAVRQAADDVAVARLDVTAATQAVTAARAQGQDAVAKARSDQRVADRDADTAAAELGRARQAVPTARRQVTLAAQRMRVLQEPTDTSIQKLLAESAAAEARGTAEEVARLARKIGVLVPANEVLFFPTLPLRVDSVRAKRGDSASGRVMTVSNSRLAVDSSLSLDDAKLVRVGAPVKVEEPDLGVRTGGVVTQVADRPGTNKVDPSRVYLEVTPGAAPAQLVGASVRLSIAVESTERRVLTVPVNALSVGADGSSRVQVQRPGGRSEFVNVEAGLAAQGLVEVRPVGARLRPGGLVVVGAKGASSATNPAATAPRSP